MDANAPLPTHVNRTMLVVEILMFAMEMAVDWLWVGRSEGRGLSRAPALTIGATADGADGSGPPPSRRPVQPPPASAPNLSSD